MDNQILLPNYTSTPPPHEVKDAFVPINTDANVQEKKSLIRNDEIMITLKIAADTNPNLEYHSDTILPPTPDTIPDTSCEIESFGACNQHFQQDEMTSSPVSPSYNSKDLFNTTSEQKIQLHRLETVPISETKEYNASSFQTMDLPLGLHIAQGAEPMKKRPRVDSLLNRCSTPAGEDEGFEEYPIPPPTPTSQENIEKKPFVGIHEIWTDEEEEVYQPSPINQYKLITNKEPKTINQPYNYLTSQPGKDIRKQILAAFNVWLKIDAVSLDIINRVVGMLHNASLL